MRSITALILVSFMVALVGCQQEVVKPQAVAEEKPVEAIGFRTGFYKSEKESDDQERVYYLLNETLVTRMVFSDAGLESSSVEGTYTVEGDAVIFKSPSGSKRTYTVTPDGNLKSGLGAIWVYSGEAETEVADGSGGEVIFKDSLHVKTVGSMKGTYLEGWYDEAQALYFMRFSNESSEIILQSKDMPAGKLFESDKSSGNSSLYGVQFHLYYLEEEGTDPITGEAGLQRTLVTVER